MPQSESDFGSDSDSTSPSEYGIVLHSQVEGHGLRRYKEGVKSKGKLVRQRRVVTLWSYRVTLRACQACRQFLTEWLTKELMLNIVHCLLPGSLIVCQID